MRPLKLVAVTSDLFLQSRFLELARSQGVEVQVLVSPDSVLVSSVHGPTLVVLDLAATEYDPFETARSLKKSSGNTTLLGYYPHVRSDLKRRAGEGGFDHVVTNRDLVAKLSRLLAGTDG